MDKEIKELTALLYSLPHGTWKREEKIEFFPKKEVNF